MKTKLLSAALVILACFTTDQIAGAALTFQLFYEFNPTNSGPAYPAASLVQGSDGNFYGTTSSGGTNGDYGTVFQMTPDGILTTLFSFSATNGSYPNGELGEGSDGNFYGTTSAGGMGYNGTPESGNGTVFQITTNGALTTLLSFNGTNGSTPIDRLMQGSDGNFYGTTSAGGLGYDGTPGTGNGTVFKITSSGTLTTLFSFNFSNGSSPNDLVKGIDGNFYGTTANGGLYGGTVFQLTTNGTLTTLVFFLSSFPGAGLAQGSDGNFYGTTMGDSRGGHGTVFRVTTNGALTTLLSFSGTNGDFSLATLRLGDDGSFYGTALQGGTGYNGTPGSGNGTVFKITTNGTLTTLHFFNGTNGSRPLASLVQGSDGSFYGTTVGGGAYDGGTIFRLVQPTRPVITAIARSNGIVTLTWTSFANGIYRVEHKPSLTATGWAALTPDVTATNSTASFTDNPLSDIERYYRVVLQP